MGHKKYTSVIRGFANEKRQVLLISQNVKLFADCSSQLNKVE